MDKSKGFIEKHSTILVTILLMVFFVQTFIGSFNSSLAVDEISHISSGYSYIRTGDFRLNVEATPLVDMISALPLLLIQPHLPLEHETWKLAEHNEIQGQYHWPFGEQFFFYSGNDEDNILHFARFPVMLLGVILGFFIFKWAKELFGVKSGLLALLLYSFSPNILAHSGLATIDIGSSCFIFIAVYYFWRFMNDIGPKSLLIAGFTFGLAQLSKYTALSLIPTYGIILAIVIFSRVIKTKRLFSRDNLLLVGMLCLIFIIGALVITLGYGITQVIKYVDGFAWAFLHSSGGHNDYLLGMRSTSGWWYYFIIAFLIKSTIATLLFGLLSIVFITKHLKRKDLYSFLFILTPIAVFLLLSMTSKLNIGVRHILPIYPFIFLFVSRLALIDKLKWVIVILCVLHIVSSALIFPHYIAYFNAFVGGAENGPKYLLDSNIDWGQDLKRLKMYLDENKIEHTYLGYWGKDKPEYRGINFTQVPCYPVSGIVAVSVNNLYGIKDEKSSCIKWLMEYEPIAKVGYSIYVYDIKDVDDVKEQLNYCVGICRDGCTSNGYSFKNVTIINGSCDCACYA